MKVVSDFSRHDATSRSGIEVHSAHLSAKRSRPFFITLCRLKSGTTFATRSIEPLRNPQQFKANHDAGMIYP